MELAAGHHGNGPGKYPLTANGVPGRRVPLAEGEAGGCGTRSRVALALEPRLWRDSCLLPYPMVPAIGARRWRQISQR